MGIINRVREWLIDQWFVDRRIAPKLNFTTATIPKGYGHKHSGRLQCWHDTFDLAIACDNNPGDSNCDCNPRTNISAHGSVTEHSDTCAAHPEGDVGAKPVANCPHTGWPFICELKYRRPVCVNHRDCRCAGAVDSYNHYYDIKPECNCEPRIYHRGNCATLAVTEGDGCANPLTECYPHGKCHC